MLLQELADSYLPLGTLEDADYSCYRVATVEDLEAPFSEFEIWDVLLELNGHSAPGLDCISNKLLRTLNGKSIVKLIEEINKIWVRDLES